MLNAFSIDMKGNIYEVVQKWLAMYWPVLLACDCGASQHKTYTP